MYQRYHKYFSFSDEFSWFKSFATCDSMITFPQFYLVIHITSNMTFLYDIGKNFIMINYYDESGILLRRFCVVKKTKLKILILRI